MLRCWQGTTFGGAGGVRIPAGAAVTAELEKELADGVCAGVASKTEEADAVGGGSPSRDADAGALCADDRTQQLHWHPAAPQAIATAAIAVIATFAKLGSA